MNEGQIIGLLFIAIAAIILLCAVIYFILQENKNCKNYVKHRDQQFIEAYKDLENLQCSTARALLNPKHSQEYALLYCLFKKEACGSYILNNKHAREHWLKAPSFKLKESYETYRFEEAMAICKKLIASPQLVK